MSENENMGPPTDAEIEAWEADIGQHLNEHNRARTVALMRRARRAPVVEIPYELAHHASELLAKIAKNPQDGEARFSYQMKALLERIVAGGYNTQPTTAPAGLAELQERARAWVGWLRNTKPGCPEDSSGDIVKALAALDLSADAEPAAPASPGLLAAAEDIAFNHGSFSDYVRRRDALRDAIANEKSRPAISAGERAVMDRSHEIIAELRAERDELREKLERAEKAEADLAEIKKLRRSVEAAHDGLDRLGLAKCESLAKRIDMLRASVDVAAAKAEAASGLATLRRLRDRLRGMNWSGSVSYRVLEMVDDAIDECEAGAEPVPPIPDSTRFIDAQDREWVRVDCQEPQRVAVPADVREWAQNVGIVYGDKSAVVAEWILSLPAAEPEQSAEPPRDDGPPKHDERRMCYALTQVLPLEQIAAVLRVYTDPETDAICRRAVGGGR